MKVSGILLLFFSHLLFFEIFAQNIIVGKIQNNILYAGIENKVGLSTKDGRSFEIVSHNQELINIFKDSSINTKSISNIQHYIFYPFSLTKQKPFIYFKDPATQLIFDSISFEIKPLPHPIVFLGSTPEGEKISISDSKLTYRFQEINSIDIQFEIISWEIIIEGNDEVFIGQGNTLSQNAKLAIDYSKSGSLISILVDVRYSTGGTKKVSAIFKK